MKKLLTFFIAGAAIAALSTANVACNAPASSGNSEDPTELSIVPLSVSDDVADYFDENAQLIARAAINDNFDPAFADCCLMINSTEELPETLGYDDLPLKYPDIDFDSHTLVLGQWIGGATSYLASQSVVVEQGEAILNIKVDTKMETGVDYNSAIYPIYFWGIYPKIDANTISLNVTREN